ncbi:class I SAM-dependent methyltransferase [Bacillus sp. HMF5848]|uniref:class I SAM-dependent methyltransferase n=1 Tax=Bacillus sp. HMF5848 TaxID=2495421 RepID=UPI000F7A2086|nr:class I SAM-dependent methyltransferase [Bacillus sp. HMF5848]RSK25650.1 class I SAM-dependent methyltransferase [Bacillus sp. HMF5848]
MNFYTILSKYYDTIFPVNSVQINFITQHMHGKSLLDVAAGTGNQAVELAKLGYNVTAVDLDPSMVHSINRKATEQQVTIHTDILNMIDIKSLQPLSYDTITCIGNSLSHLSSIDEITQALQGFTKVLNKNGTIIIQIVNYNRIFAHSIKQLPTINRPPVKFERSYELCENNKIIFNGTLTVDDEQYESSVTLYGIQAEQLVSSLNNAGFHHIELFGSFKGEPYTSIESPALVVVARKE